MFILTGPVQLTRVAKKRSARKVLSSPSFSAARQTPCCGVGTGERIKRREGAQEHSQRRVRQAWHQGVARGPVGDWCITVRRGTQVRGTVRFYLIFAQERQEHRFSGGVWRVREQVLGHFCPAAGRHSAPQMAPAAACRGEHIAEPRHVPADNAPCTGAAGRSRRCVSSVLRAVIFVVGLVTCGMCVDAEILSRCPPPLSPLNTNFRSCVSPSGCPHPEGAAPSRKIAAPCYLCLLDVMKRAGRC